MCGIAGYAKTPSGQTRSQMRTVRKISKSLLNSIAERGKDSTGIAMLSENSEPIIHKTLRSSDELVKSKAYSKIANQHRGDTSICMMHTRYSTMDRKNIRQSDAHPFAIGKTIGSHNGIVYNFDSLDQEHKGLYPVDSQYIFHYIEQEDNLQSALDKIYGDYAISWVKNSNRVLNLLHEGGRDLAMAYWKEARVLFYASRPEYLNKALVQSRINAKIFEAKHDTHYVYNVDKFSTQQSGCERTLVDTRVLEAEYGYSYGNYGNCSIDGGWVYEAVDCVECNMKVDKFDVIVEDGKYTCLDCEFINKGLDEKALYGLECSFCKDIGDVLHRDGKEYICDTCVESPMREEVDYGYEQYGFFD
tara:strand:+ start:1128 stop:2207 length:1080 start_codon:yes stop_codon:yes gene_type:complete